MTVTRLYHPAPIAPGQTIQLEKNASHHLIKVMRNKIDATVSLFNGDGYEYSSTIVDNNLKHCHVRVDKKNNTQRESPIHIILLQGISRGDRMDICIQKSTELGVNTIIPVNCERSTIKLGKERSDKKHEHWKQVMISACEQSGRCVLPEIQSVTTYSQAIESMYTGLKFVLDPTSESGLNSFESVEKTICILAGPEGGLSQNEINLARDNGFHAVHLGPRILRTETAGPACISAIQTLWGDLS